MRQHTLLSSIGFLLVVSPLLLQTSCGSTPEDVRGFEVDDSIDPRIPTVTREEIPFHPGGEGNVTCATLDAGFEPQPLTVTVLVDQSGSMTHSYPGGSRWSVLYEALMDPDDGVVAAIDSEVRFGLTLYTSYDGWKKGGTCPVLTEVAPAYDNYAHMDAIYAPAEPEDDTPTGEAMLAVAEQMAASDAEGTQLILLATDGEPDNCAVPDPQLGQEDALAAATTAFDLGVKSYILGVGDEVGETHLQHMANAGIGQPLDGDATYYQPANRAELVEAMRDIIDGERFCVLPLDGEVDPALASLGEVFIDGEKVTYGLDWQMSGTDHVELLGDACEWVKHGSHEITGNFVCTTIILPTK